MSDRHRDHRGSRSSRDDYRKHKERERPTRSRSRSPRKNRSPAEHTNTNRSKRSGEKDLSYKEKRRDYQDEVEEVPAPPPPPRISKISIGFQKPSAPIKMTLGAKPTSVSKPTISSVFSADDDDEPEEMPAEAKMRMRNIGRETPTSAGPNSFGKTKQGFCDAKKVFEKNLKQALETADKPAVKFPQTIYKIKGP